MIRFGLIGYGAIGRFRAAALRQTPGAELAMIVDAVAARADEARASWGVETSTEMAALLSRDDIDAVIVSTPPNLHLEHCTAALAAGKHVLCEKPLATTVNACRQIVAAAERVGRVLGTGFNYRFYPAVEKARSLVRSGRIGEVDYVMGFAGHPGGPDFTHPWVHDPSIMGGGALMDNGIHAADLTLHFLGRVAEATGHATDRVWGFGASEDNGFVLMRSDEGRVGVLHASWTQWRGYRFHVEIYGVAGCIRVWYPPMLTILHDRPAGNAKRGRRRIFAFPWFQVNERLRSYRWTIVRSFVAEQLDFLQRLGGRPGVGATGVDGLRAVELAHAAYGRPVRHAAAPPAGGADADAAVGVAMSVPARV